MKKIFLSSLFLLLFLSLTACGNTKENIETNSAAKEKTSKILIAYFSRTGNTKEIALKIQEKTNGELFEIQPAEPYPENYKETTDKAKQELNSGYLPPLKSKRSNLESYDIIFIGYPIWWGTIPGPVRTFLTENNFSGKTIIPFCTHGGSGLSSSASDIQKLSPQSKMKEAFAISGSQAKNSENALSEWLNSLQISE